MLFLVSRLVDQRYVKVTENPSTTTKLILWTHTAIVYAPWVTDFKQVASVSRHPHWSVTAIAMHSASPVAKTSIQSSATLLNISFLQISNMDCHPCPPDINDETTKSLGSSGHKLWTNELWALNHRLNEQSEDAQSCPNKEKPNR